MSKHKGTIQLYFISFRSNTSVSIRYFHFHATDLLKQIFKMNLNKPVIKYRDIFLFTFPHTSFILRGARCQIYWHTTIMPLSASLFNLSLPIWKSLSSYCRPIKYIRMITLPVKRNLFHRNIKQDVTDISWY